MELSVSPTSLEFTSDASNDDVSITATQSWTASDNQSWISVSPTSGTADDDITVSVTSNSSGSSRDGTVTISDNSGLGLLSKTIDVHQADVPSITLSASTVDLYGSSDSDQVTVTSNTTWSYYVDYWDDYAWLQITRTNTGYEYNATLSIAATRAPTSGSWEAQIVIQGGGLTRYINVTVYP
ncbi:MAG: BACON domain-containing carbohydrate-binding protein [Bacteroidota bacterium]|nr:BACON domain-containing carbohydrate-binding protein [Bacteroidota bacterium]